MTSFPFSYNWLISKSLQANIKTVLDLGCGEGTFGLRFNQNKKYQITGTDIFTPYLKKALSTGRYRSVKKVDLTKKLPFYAKQFDLVVCLETIEHLKKIAGEKLLSEMERVGKKMIIISSPIGIASQEDYDKNIHQKHQSSWYPKDLSVLGYKVYGIGLKIVYGKHTHVNHQMKIHTIPFYLLSFLANPIVNLFPSIGAQMLAVKKFNAKK